MQEINTADPSTLIPARRGDLEKLFGSGRVGAIPLTATAGARCCSARAALSPG